jgi:hypothetical protein
MRAMRELPVAPIRRTPVALLKTPNQRHVRAVPFPHEGRFAIVTSVRCGMRWTRYID